MSGYIPRRTPLRRKHPLRGSKLASKAPARRQPSQLAKAKKKLWTLCRTLTRLRFGNTCYTCGLRGLEGGNWQTGHFVSSSICSTALRYDLRNLRPQCYSCNINKSGNWLAFEARLTREHGQAYVDELKAENERTKGESYRLDWYETKISEYQALLDNLTT